MNWNLVVGFIMAFAIGAVCRWQNIPVPAPPSLIGVMLIFAITIGYITADRLLGK